MAKRPSAYTGKEPFVFISYAHKDAGRVYPIIERLQRLGIRVWYDEGLEPGSHWDDMIARNLMDCAYVVCFITKNFLESENCLNEIHMAAEEQKGPLITYLERVDLPPAMKLQYGRRHALSYPQYESLDAFVENIADSEILKRCRSTSGKPDKRKTEEKSSHPAEKTAKKPVEKPVEKPKPAPAIRKSVDVGETIWNIFQTVTVILLVLALLGSVVFPFLFTRTFACAALISVAVVIVLLIFIGIIYGNDLGFEETGEFLYGGGMIFLVGPIVLLLLCFGLYEVYGMYGTGDMVIRDDVLVACYLDAETVEVPEGVEEIRHNAFAEILLKRGKEIECIILPNSVKRINERAFAHCENLETIYIGPNVKSIGANAFMNCKNLEIIYFYGIQEDWDDIDKATGILGNWDAGLGDYEVIFLDPADRT